jgi:hypothetical protein
MQQEGKRALGKGIKRKTPTRENAREVNNPATQYIFSENLFSTSGMSLIFSNTLLFRTMRSRDRDVVLVRRTIYLGCWEFGIGREGGGDGEGEVSLRATWGQGGQDRITPKEGFQVSEKEVEGGVTKN